MDDSTALAFNTICNFIRDLNGSFGNRQKSLMLYGHLIEKTGLIHIEPVKKHIGIFKHFVEENRDAIEGRNKNAFKTDTIFYSEKVGINMRSIFELCDKEEEKVIWTHLLTISAVLDPLGNAKQVLKTISATTSNKNAQGDNFLKNIMEKIGSEVENCDADNINPMQMIGNLMSSGALNDIFQSISSGVNDGNLDLGSMLNTMQSMVGNLNQMVPPQPSTSTPTTTTTTATTTDVLDTPTMSDTTTTTTTEE